jgi:predicted TIM-barrel fold metal-dependent hydrolase
MTMTRPDILEDHTSGGSRGVNDVDVRLAQMDREGIAAELVYHGDLRANDLGHNISNGVWPFEVWDAGARGYNRWVYDAFGSVPDRLLLTAAIGSCTDMPATIAELDSIAEHGFIGTFMPGFMRHRDMPPLFDPYWEPFFTACEAQDLALVVHAGFGFEQGVVYDGMARVDREIAESGGSEMDRVMLLARDVFTADFFSSVKGRRPMWQLMFGGVFDRHPNLKLVMSEVRADWIPAVFAHLDALYDRHREQLPAQRRPSEYWRSNCLAGASFMHKAEVEMRHEIGVEQILFGRDYPHPEGTWPNTSDWLRDAFAGVPEDELRLMLGENAIGFFGLDRAPLEAIAERIGPEVADIVGPGVTVDEELLTIFDGRGGYRGEAEGTSRLAEIEPMIAEDLVGFGARA